MPGGPQPLSDAPNVQLFDSDQLLEIVLTAELMIRASKSRRRLSRAEIDTVLRVRRSDPGPGAETAGGARKHTSAGQTVR